MAIDFGALLSDEQKKQILEQRVAQFAAEAFQHGLNKQVAEKIGNEEGVAQADAALATLEEALAVHKDELDKLA